MRDYEIVYIFRPELESDELDEKLRGFHDRLDGEVTAVEHWGSRQLAYEIAGERSGYYVVAQYNADPASLEGFEQALKHDEQLIRHLVVLAEGELPAPPSEREATEEESDDDEGGEASDEESEESADEEDRDDEGEEDEGEDDEDADGEDEEGVDEDDEGDEDEDREDEEPEGDDDEDEED